MATAQPRVTVRRDFVKIDVLQNVLTDTHFAKRDRMGRTLTFLARIMKDGWSPAPKEIAVDEKSAVLVERNGKGRVIGSGKGAYFLSTRGGPEVCGVNTPLTFRDITVYRGPSGSEFNLREWKGKVHEVLTTANGFEYGGETYKSLSPIACRITGTHWSGPAFFAPRP